MRKIYPLGDEQSGLLIEENGTLYFASRRPVEPPPPPAAQPSAPAQAPIDPRHLAWLTAIAALG
jgi:hypothetical protein